MVLDDHKVVLTGILMGLSNAADIDIIGAFSRSRDLLAAMKTSTPDIILLDYELEAGDTDGINLIRAITIKHPHTSVLIMSGHYNTATVALALRSGARGFVGKSQDLEEMIEAIRALADGKIYVEAMMAAELASQSSQALRSKRVDHADNKIAKLVRISQLSPKEQDVIRCFMSGMTVSEIAEKFSRSVKTISGQKQTAMKKLGLKADHELFILRDEIKK